MPPLCRPRNVNTALFETFLPACCIPHWGYRFFDVICHDHFMCTAIAWTYDLYCIYLSVKAAVNSRRNTKGTVADVELPGFVDMNGSSHPIIFLRLGVNILHWADYSVGAMKKQKETITMEKFGWKTCCCCCCWELNKFKGSKNKIFGRGYSSTIAMNVVLWLTKWNTKRIIYSLIFSYIAHSYPISSEYGSVSILRRLILTIKICRDEHKYND